MNIFNFVGIKLAANFCKVESQTLESESDSLILSVSCYCRAQAQLLKIIL